LISVFSLLFWFSITILSYASILAALQLQTQKLMTSQISRSRKEYLLQCYNILVQVVLTL